VFKILCYETSDKLVILGAQKKTGVYDGIRRNIRARENPLPTVSYDYFREAVARTSRRPVEVVRIGAVPLVTDGLNLGCQYMPPLLAYASNEIVT
jgi:hypothetical protein